MATGTKLNLEPASGTATDERLRILTENLADAIVVVDRAGIICYDSPTIQRMLGDAIGELDGTNAFDLVHPDDLPLAQRLFGELLQEPGATRTAEFRLHHHDGSWRNVAATGKNLLANPVIGGIVLTARDITKRQQIEQELRATIAELTSFNRVAVDRELRMIELKKEINALCTAAGQPPRYRVEAEP